MTRRSSSGPPTNADASLTQAVPLVPPGRARPPLADTDRTGCHSRNDILACDLTEVIYRPQRNECVLEQGVPADPYTGQVAQFNLGNDTPPRLDFGHGCGFWDVGAVFWLVSEICGLGRGH